MTLRAIKAAALKLPRADRGKLAVTLLSSLDKDEPEEVERAWVEEADRRYRAYKAGKTSGAPAMQALAKARAAFRK